MKRSFFLSTVIHFVIGLAEAILLLRIILRLFAANPGAEFVHWVYATSNTLLEPFRGIFPSTVVAKSYVLDFTALFALIVYAVLGSILVALVGSVESGFSSHKVSGKKS